MVNLKTAERQALGTHFVAGPQDKKLVADLCGGHLTLPPHKRWQLPAAPTWAEDPFSDNNWQFQYHMLRWLDPLRRAGQNGNAQAAEAWQRYARSWIEANPPGDSASRWAWIDMADGIRAMELCHGLGVVGEQDWLIRSLEQHRDWLADPSHLKHGNHGLHQTLGLFVVSAVLEDRDSMDLAVDWLGQRLRGAWDEQGVNEEGSLAYHRMNYLWWQDAMTRLDLEGVDRPDGAQRLSLAPEEMAHATSPLGRLARIGDTNAASIRDIDHPYADFVTSEGTRGAAPAKTTAIYDRGYAYIRSGWGQNRPFSDETYLTAVFGAQDKIHGHVDGGSVTYCSQGVQWLHDAGRYYYGRHPMQDYMKSRAAHSLVVLPGRTADKGTPVELMRSEITDDCTDLLLSDASYDGVSITRRIVYLRHWDLTVVLDRVESQEPVQAEQRWHCGREVSATALSTGFALSHGEGTFHVSALTKGQRRDVRSGQDRPMIGWTATGWRRSTPVNVGTVYDEGTQLTFGALLGTWTPMAVDLLTRQLSDASDITVPLRELIPAALLRSPWPGARTTAARRKPAVLEASAQVMGPETVKVVADGRGRYFAFDLYDGKQLVQRVPWLSRGEQTFDLTGVGEPRLHVKNRSTPADLQQVSVTADDWGLLRPSVASTAAHQDPARTLLLVETMFCDNEQDPAVLDTYFERFRLCLSSLQSLKIPEGAECLVTIYMSTDKQRYIDEVLLLLENGAAASRLSIRVHQYTHPTDGYPGPDRIDWLKSPNKHAPYRDRLFAEAHRDIGYGAYDRLIRLAIDDDDIFLPHHGSNILAMADAAQADAPDADVVILGPLRTFIAYVSEDGVDLEEVEMRRSLTGNKAFVIRDPQRVDPGNLSPWSAPELMTAVQAKSATGRGQQLRPVHANAPSFVYMRWGQNLSSHRKDFHITEALSARHLAAVSDLLSIEEDVSSRSLSFDPVPLDLRLTVRRDGTRTAVTSNFDRLRVGTGKICFQIFDKGTRIASTSYSQRSSAVFPDIPPGAQVRGYVKLDGKIVGRCQVDAS